MFPVTVAESTSVAVIGRGPLARRFTARIDRSPLMIEVVDDPAPGDLAVREEPSPDGAYLGVASAGRPGEFFLTDERSIGYLIDLVEHFVVSGARSVVVRRPIENEWAAVGSERARRKRLRAFRPDDYVWIGTESIDDDIFDGDALLSADGDEVKAHLRVSGYLDPLDGLYHWAGTVFGADVRTWKDDRVKHVTVSIGGGGPVDARLAEVTPSGAVRVVGVGEPPYPLEPLTI
ncbi:DUF4873 domain-containing protein [Streptomyces sp. SID6673]|nr:DUF4873 domain-containing protein [Streptomyces sp. SID11726]NEB26322.1 DUF4873 domain-containing protein [Streptomyces sp. SID6673]